ncbi:MAG: phenylalanine--tRNA ligase subunit beta [Endomicrobiia bacterium]
MKLSLNWIKEILNSQVDISDDKIISVLEDLGYEIESIQKQKSEVLSKVKVVKVLDLQKHPNADKLTLCRISDGKKEYNVVCGAPNVYKGMLTAYICSGNVLADGTKIEVRKIRGIESNGMLCSEKELGISENHSGILELDESFKIGDSLDKYFNDTIIEISTPANRFDCLGHLGIAKEVAIKLGIEFRNKNESISVLESKQLPFFDVKVVSNELCKRYIAINIQNVNNNCKLPFYITQRISSCGIRSINPLVDISNYVMLETGHSVHIFDYDKLLGGKIVVRCAESGESIVALDGKKYNLDKDIIIIADEKNPIAIAGIIGAKESSVNNETKNVVVESAVFNRSMVRLARKKLSITTEASYRFERGSGWQLCELAAMRTQQMILNYCKGNIARFTDYKDLEYYKNITSHFTNGINVNLNFISSLLGIEVEIKDFIELMRKIGSEVILGKSAEETKRLIVLPPLNRPDIKFQADIAEEVARFYGYEKIPTTIPNIVSSTIKIDNYSRIKNKIINLMSCYGVSQAINYSLCSSKENEVVKDCNTKKIVVLNSVSNEFNELRLSLLSGLLRNLITNYNNQNENIALFEIGKIYYRENNNTIEKENLGIILCGSKNFLSWRQKILDYDFYFINGIIENLLSELKIKYKKKYFVSNKNSSRPLLDESLVKNYLEYLSQNDEVIGFSCELKKDKFKLTKISAPVLYSEIYLDIISDLFQKEYIFESLAKYPFVLRDLCLVLPDENINYEQIVETIKDFIKNNFKTISIEIEAIDYYKKDNFLSLTLSLKLQDKTKTLTDGETNDIINLILEELRKYRIELRRG